MASVRLALLLVLLTVLVLTEIGPEIGVAAREVAARITGLGRSGWAFPAVVGAYLAGSFVALPGILLLYGSVGALGTTAGVVAAWTATLLSASVFFSVARVLGREVLHARHARLATRLEEFLTRPALLRVLQLRLIPLVPFHVVNIGCGALAVPFPAFLAGTAAGVIPKLTVNLVFVDAIVKGSSRPAAVWLAQLGVGLALLGITVLVGRSLMPRELTRRPEPY